MEHPKTKDRQPTSMYGIICPEHGIHGLTYNEFMDQLSRANTRWLCPICGGMADFDEDRYEAGSNA